MKKSILKLQKDGGQNTKKQGANNGSSAWAQKQKPKQTLT